MTHSHAPLIHVLVDLDHLSRTEDGHHADADTFVRTLTGVIDTARRLAASIGAETRVRAACSSATAFVRWPVLTSLPNNMFQLTRTATDAGLSLDVDLDHLRGRASTAGVVLVTGAGDRADAVGRLTAAGIPVWVCARQGALAARLEQAATRCSDLRVDGALSVPQADSQASR